jgi:hypothetical protein
MVTIKSKIYGDECVVINDEHPNYAIISLMDSALMFEWSYSADRFKNPDDEVFGTDPVFSEGKIICNPNMFSSVKLVKHKIDDLWEVEVCFNGTDRGPYIEFKNRAKAIAALNQIEEWLKPVLTINK